jgi:hypothetical protein
MLIALDESLEDFQDEGPAAKRGFLRAENSTRRLRDIRSNAYDAAQVIEVARFVLRK